MTLIIVLYTVGCILVPISIMGMIKHWPEAKADLMSGGIRSERI